MNKHEAVMNALFKVLKQIPDVDVYKNEPLAQKVPENGALFLRDGNIDILETLLSPPRVVYQHRAELEIIVQNVASQARDLRVSELMDLVNSLLATTKDLCGEVDCFYTEPPEFILEAPEGGIPIKAVIIPIFLEYLI